MVISRLLRDIGCTDPVALPAGTSVPFGRTRVYSAPVTALFTLRNHFDGAHCRTSIGIGLLMVGVVSVNTG